MRELLTADGRRVAFVRMMMSDVSSRWRPGRRVTQGAVEALGSWLADEGRGSARERRTTLAALGVARLLLGERDAAVDAWSAATTSDSRSDQDDRAAAADQCHGIGLVLLHLGEPLAARDFLLDGERRYLDLGISNMAACCETHLGQVMLDTGDEVAAEIYLARSRAKFHRLQTGAQSDSERFEYAKQRLAYCNLFLGIVYARTSRPVEAREAWLRAVRDGVGDVDRAWVERRLEWVAASRIDPDTPPISLEYTFGSH